MVNNRQDYSSVIVRTELGAGTGDERWQTADGRWWEPWDGTIQTGKDVKELRRLNL